MAKKSFIKKNALKNAPDVLMQFGVAQAGTLAGLGANQLVQTKVPKLAKFSGPILMGLGLAAEIFVDNDLAVAAGRGIGAAGTVVTAQQFLPETVKAKVGLNGLGANEPLAEAEVDWVELARRNAEVQDDDGGNMSGIDDLDDDELAEAVMNA